ncbi:MAG: hypothetical protein Q4C65_03525 [Eubacteriales bacterium]|nr:hypothetical protein [Eubacteriales bacterium]
MEEKQREISGEVIDGAQQPPASSDKKEEKRQQRELAKEEKRLQKQEAREQKLQARQERREHRQLVRKERRHEWSLLWKTAEFVMLIAFAVLAIDQAGLYGFLFVWLFVGLAAASVGVLLVGLAQAVMRKRSGILLLAALIGIIGCLAWFVFLVSERGLGLGPVY